MIWRSGNGGWTSGVIKVYWLQIHGVDLATCAAEYVETDEEVAFPSVGLYDFSFQASEASAHHPDHVAFAV